MASRVLQVIVLLLGLLTLETQADSCAIKCAEKKLADKNNCAEICDYIWNYFKFDKENYTVELMDIDFENKNSEDLGDNISSQTDKQLLRGSRRIVPLGGNLYWNWLWSTGAKRTYRTHAFFRIGRNDPENIAKLRKRKSLGYFIPVTKEGVWMEANDDTEDEITKRSRPHRFLRLGRSHTEVKSNPIYQEGIYGNVVPQNLDVTGAADFLVGSLDKRSRRHRFLRLGRDTVKVLKELQNEKGNLKSIKNKEESNMLAEKRRSRFMRVGRGDDDSKGDDMLYDNKTSKDMREEKRHSRFMRVGRNPDESNENLSEEKRRSRFMRVGKKWPKEDSFDKSEEKRRSRFMRVGRDPDQSDETISEEKRRSRFMRVGKKWPKEDSFDKSEEKRRSRFMRVGRDPDQSDETISEEKRRSRFMRVGKKASEEENLDKIEEKRRSRFMRVGRNPDQSDESLAESKRRSRFMRVGKKKSEDHDENKVDEKRRSRFMRVGRGHDVKESLAEKVKTRPVNDGTNDSTYISETKSNENVQNTKSDNEKNISEEKRRNRFMRVGKSGANSDNKNNDYLETDGIDAEKRRSRFMRVGRDPEKIEDKRRSRFMRVGRGTDL